MPGSFPVFARRAVLAGTQHCSRWATPGRHHSPARTWQRRRSCRGASCLHRRQSRRRAEVRGGAGVGRLQEGSRGSGLRRHHPKCHAGEAAVCVAGVLAWSSVHCCSQTAGVLPWQALEGAASAWAAELCALPMLSRSAEPCCHSCHPSSSAAGCPPELSPAKQPAGSGGWLFSCQRVAVSELER